MCTVTRWKSCTCHHRWLTISTLCHESWSSSSSIPGGDALEVEEAEMTGPLAASTQMCPTAYGFNTCPLLARSDGRIRMNMIEAERIARPKTCPQCYFGGRYDRNLIRMVRKMEFALDFGFSPVAPRTGQVGVCCVVC